MVPEGDMGREAVCSAEYGGERSEGRAHLDTDALTFRGGFRLSIPYGEVDSAEAVDGSLRIRFGSETAVLNVGKDAGAWAERIQNPPSLMKKLGVRPGITAAIVEPLPPELGVGRFADELAREGVEVVGDSAPAGIVFFRVEDPSELARISELKRRIPADGAIWVITPRGRKELQDVVIMAAVKAAGLVDNKVCRFSDTHTALRFVIPRADRPGRK